MRTEPSTVPNGSLTVRTEGGGKCACRFAIFLAGGGQDCSRSPGGPRSRLRGSAAHHHDARRCFGETCTEPGPRFEERGVFRGALPQTLDGHTVGHRGEALELHPAET